MKEPGCPPVRSDRLLGSRRMSESRGDALDDRQQGARWYHTVQAEARLKVKIPELVLSSLPAPATHQHAHIGRQDRDVLCANTDLPGEPARGC